MGQIIGRIYEQDQLRKRIASDSAELIAFYGRRRIGKTYLVRQFFNETFDFYYTGIFQGSKDDQLKEFSRQLSLYSSTKQIKIKNWFDAFALLRQYLDTINGRPIIVFLDELPWIDTPKSNFLKAFEYFWNSWGISKKNLKCIICGSATTWMRNNVLLSKGGLYNRTTISLYLAPFSLYETQEYLYSRGIVWNKYQIVECYMILGGIPQYLSLIEKGSSLAQNIDNLFFKPNASLSKEYNYVFRSLYKDDSLYKQIVELLAQKAEGMTRKEIKDALHIKDNGNYTTTLSELIDCDFIRAYSSFGKKERNTIYQLTDLFTLFYLRYVMNYKGQDSHHWQNMIDSPSRRAWSGYSFEQVCLHHINQIKTKLGISGVQTDVYSWKGSDSQIDLILDRRDQIINLCEIKYSLARYMITKQYDEHLRERRESFRLATKTNKALHLTFISTYGIKDGMYKDNIQNEILIEDLFMDV